MADLFQVPLTGSQGEAGGGVAASRHSNRSYWQLLSRALVAASVVHAAFCMVFFALHAPLMGWVNVGSVLVYVAAWALLARRHNRLATWLVWAELLLHALAATRVLGWESGFHYYVLLMMPMVFMSPSRGLQTKLLLGGGLAAFYLGIDAMAHGSAPLNRIAPAALDTVRAFNIVVTLGLLAHLANEYQKAVGRAERRLQQLAATDTLTHLANRRHALAVAQQQLGRRRNDGTPLSFVLGDVDHFKAINDSHGHDVGDAVLLAVAQALKAATRSADTVCRWGGEEFLVVLPETAQGEALQVAGRVRDAVQRVSVPHGGQVLAVTITLGVSTLREGETLEQAIARADAALYRGKGAGRNCCVGEDEAPQVAPQPEPAIAA